MTIPFIKVVSLVLPLPDPSKPEQHEACCPLGKSFSPVSGTKILNFSKFSLLSFIPHLIDYEIGSNSGLN